MTEITVTGSAESRVLADKASLSASVSLSGEVREELLRLAGEAHAGLVDRARELVTEGAASSYSAEAVTTHSSSWRDGGELVVEHRANAGVRIELVDLSRVGELAAELTEGGASVLVLWELGAELRGEWARRLRGAAVADARVAAEDFAEAISANRLTLVSLRDRAGRQEHYAEPRVMGIAAPATPEVTVGELAVSVHVEAVFTAE